MKVLLMGGSGIISSEICNLAIDRGFDVSIMNRGLRREKMNPKARSIICDLKKDTLDSIISKLDFDGYDVIIDFVSYYRGQLSKAISIAEGRCKQFIFISTAAAYLNKSDGSRYTENDEVGNTGWQYAAEKAACEKYLIDNAHNYSFEYTIIRPYITYGETRIPYQVAPLNYYTLINRIKNRKPIPLFGKDVKCTLTTSKDFAVGAVGLFLNSKAYGQAYHITSDYHTSWKEVINYISSILGEDAILIELENDILSVGTRRLGFDAEEILYDKSRTMLFDNSKIHEAVPSFKGNTNFHEGLLQSISYYEKNYSKQIIDYTWDARIDSFLEKTGFVENKSSISIEGYSYPLTKEEKKIYKANRSDFVYYLRKITKKLKGRK